MKYALLLALLSATGCQRYRQFIGIEGTDYRATPPPAQETPGERVLTIGFTGQSNATSLAQFCPLGYSRTGRVWVEDVYDDHGHGRFELVLPTREKPVKSNISWLHLGDALIESGKYDKVIILNRGMPGWSSTKIRGNAGWIREAQDKYGPVAWCWIQGESDYHDSIPTEVTYENMKEIIKAVGGRWFVALNATWDESHVKPWLGTPERVIKAQRQIIEEGYALQGPDLMPLKLNPLYAEDGGAEFIGEGLRKHGEAWLEVLIQAGL